MNARLLIALVLITLCPAAAWACPYCSAEMQTLSEELADADAAVIAKLVKPASGDEAPTIDPETGLADFEIETFIKGERLLKGVDTIKAIYFGTVDFEKRFLVRGMRQSDLDDTMDWAIPLGLSPLAVEYVQQLPKLPESGAERLAFFQPYLEHEDRQLAQDAYDEFARASYDDLKALKPQIDHERVVSLINDPQISPNRRRLFFTMLSVCGTQADVPMLEAMLKSDGRVLVAATEATAAASYLAGGPLVAALAVEQVQRDERKRKLGLDAMIGCYLSLTGDNGLDLIDERFLKDPKADQTHVYAALMSLRISAEEGGIVSQKRLLESARLLLDNDYFADQVIPDLARWEDWSVIDRLGEMFREADSKETISYVREPIVTYLDVAAEQEGEIGSRATALLGELESLDEETFRRARSLAVFGYLRRARPIEEQPTANAMRDAGASESNEASPADEEMPDPASFGAANAGPAEAAAEGTTDQDKAVADAVNALVGDDTANEPPTSETPSPETTTRLAAKPVIPAGAEPLTPPSTLLLLGVPLAAAAGCFGLFWMILRSGAA